MPELECAMTEQEVLQGEITEAEQQHLEFDQAIKELVPKPLVGSCNPNTIESVNCEIRQLVPPQGKCLPFYLFRSKLVATIKEHKVCIVIGRT